MGLLCVPTANVASLLKFLFKEDFFFNPKMLCVGGWGGIAVSPNSVKVVKIGAKTLMFEQQCC